MTDRQKVVFVDGARVLSTRSTPYGFKRRRYQLADGRRITTYEVPYAILSHLGAARLREAAQKWQRGECARSQAHARRQRVIALLAEGWKPIAIAHEVGITEQRVRQIRAKWRKAQVLPGDAASAPFSDLENPS